MFQDTESFLETNACWTPLCSLQFTSHCVRLRSLQKTTSLAYSKTNLWNLHSPPCLLLNYLICVRKIFWKDCYLCYICPLIRPSFSLSVHIDLTRFLSEKFSLKFYIWKISVKYVGQIKVWLKLWGGGKGAIYMNMYLNILAFTRKIASKAAEP